MRADPDTGLRSAGGLKAWKEMQQRQLEFYRGFDQEPPAKSKDSDEDSDAEYSQDVQTHLEGVERCEEAEGKPDEDDEPVSPFFPGIWPRRLGLPISRSSIWGTCSRV
jgi:hypothetical protein